MSYHNKENIRIILSAIWTHYYWLEHEKYNVTGIKIIE